VTRHQYPAVEPGALLGVMFGWAARPALVVGLLSLVAVTMAWGRAGFAGGVIGIAIVVAFYAVDLLVLRLTRSSSGGTTTAAVLGEYVAKILLLALLVWWLQQLAAIDLHGMAVTVVATTVTWVVGLTMAAFRSRSFLFDEPSASSSTRAGGGPRSRPPGAPDAS
jgi:hypothetical protein